jgi:hypothetical protein
MLHLAKHDVGTRFLEREHVASSGLAMMFASCGEISSWLSYSTGPSKE